MEYLLFIIPIFPRNLNLLGYAENKDKFCPKEYMSSFSLDSYKGVDKAFKTY
jgi:hypothetical protein